MPNGTIYRSPDNKLSQGDIVDDIPHLHFKPPITIIRPVTMRGARAQFAPFPYPPEEGKTPDARVAGKTILQEPFHVKQGELVPVLARFTRGIVLNYDCELGREENFCLIAMVRPMTGVHETDRLTIRENRNFSHFFLPMDAERGLEEAYVDLRVITCLDPKIIEAIGTRKASLTSVGVDGLQAQLFRFLTGRDFNSITPFLVEAPEP
jgi:hypothetical protein